MAVFDCNQTMEKIYEYVDGEVADNDKESIDAHLDGCSECKREYVLEIQISTKIISSSWNQSSTNELVQRAFMSFEAEQEL